MKPESGINQLRSQPKAALQTIALLSLVIVLCPPCPLSQAQNATEAWVQRYGPGRGRAIALDAAGNVFVTGHLGVSIWDVDFATIKYSNSGIPLWTNRYGGPANGGDVPVALAVGADGAVYVTGYSQRDTSGSPPYPYAYLTIKYSNEGVPLWTNLYAGNSTGKFFTAGMAVDSIGDVVVTGTAKFSAPFFDDYITIKYSSAGVPLWTNRYGYSIVADRLNDDQPSAVAIDSNRDVSVTGTSACGASLNDRIIATIKYSSAGVALWTNCYKGPGSVGGLARAMAVDASGDIYVGGLATGSNSAVIIKYSSAGLPLWTNQFSTNCWIAGMAVDHESNVIVAASSWLIVKFSSAGVVLWTKGHQMWDLWALAVDARGNAYVAGSVGSPNNISAISAFSGTGELLWTNRYHGPGTGVANFWSVAVDPDGYVYVTGESQGTNDVEYATIKYIPPASAPPTITRHPSNQTNAAGTTASFTVEAIGGSPLRYQWCCQGTNLLGGGNISGATSTNLLISNVQLADALAYSVVVNNAYGSATSHVAQLRVINSGCFTNLAYLPGLGFSFIFRDGTPGQLYRVQTSGTLAEGSWVDWQSFTYNAPIALIDMAASGEERRFYRVVSP